MKDKMYLSDKKRLLNNTDDDKDTIYDEIQSGPMEESNLIKYDLDINRFRKYEEKISLKNKKSSN